MCRPHATLRPSQAEADYWLTPSNKTAAPDFLASFSDSTIAGARAGLATSGCRSIATPIRRHSNGSGASEV
jgi:hypothetical protein